MGGDLPTLIPKIGFDVSYPRVEEVTGLPRERAFTLIQELYDEGYLERRLHTTVSRCPHDGTTCLRPRLFCPGCQSEDINRVPLIEHLNCGHVDMEKNFVSGEDLKCPKCGRTLNQIGVDYRRPGYAYNCPSCGGVHPAPDEKWSCNYADHIFMMEDAQPEKVYSYTLSETRKGDILRVFQYIQPIKETYENLGYEASTFQTVRGKSGVSHLVDVYAKKETDRLVTSIARVLTERGIKLEEVLKHYAISLDVDPTNSILIALPELDRESEVYTKQFNLEVIEGDNLETVIQQLASIIRNQ